MSLNSAIYTGQVRHRRFSVAEHRFSYSLFMLALDLNELATVFKQSWLLSRRWFSPLRFVESDYVQGEQTSVKARLQSKVQNLGGNWDGTKAIMVVQCRCFGLYFSPINFYFCYNQSDECIYMLAEVSNTPWNQRHYYLIDLLAEQVTDKAFHVSPFMNMDMQYHWRINPPNKHLLVHVENRRQDKLFDATLTLTKQALSPRQLLITLCKTPVMTLKIVAAIYWQALTLFYKKVPFIHHPQR
jgi:DUF1365 family protein